KKRNSLGFASVSPHPNPLPEGEGISDRSHPTLLFKGCVMEGLFQRVNDATQRVLEVNGCATQAPEAQVCCGALHAHAGDLEGARVYNLLEPELSQEVLTEKLKQIESSGARILATGNPGCHMQIAAGAALTGMKLRVVHPIELLDESYRRAGFYNTE